MHTLGEHPHPQRADEVAAQRSGAPHLLVVATLGVEAHDERWFTEGVTECGEMRRQIDAAALLARLDQQYTARQAHLLLLERGDRGERAEDGVTIIGCPAAVEPAVADHGLPGTKAFEPAGELRLLVEVAVEEGATGKLTGHIDQQQRGAPWQAPNLDTRARDLLRTAPLRHELHRRLHIAIALPIGIEHRRLVRDAHVRDEALEDGVIPGPGDAGLEPFKIHGAGLILSK